MPHVPGLVTAGIPEATRMAHALIHRGAETGIVVVAGERVDRARAERLPEAGAGQRVGRERRDRRRRGERDQPPPDREEGAPGSLVDRRA